MRMVSTFALATLGAMALGVVGSADGQWGGSAPAAQERGQPADSQLPLVVTEVMYDPLAVSDLDGEWFEIYNPTDTHYDLDGYVVTDTSSSSSNTFTIDGTFVVGPGEYKVFAKTANLGDPAYGASAADYVWAGHGNFQLTNSVDSIIFRDGGNEVLEFGYNDSAHGDWPVANGKSVQLNPSLTGRQRYMTWGSAWCPSTSEMAPGKDLGTPGAPGDDCPGIDIDLDTYWDEDDCDDEAPDVHVDIIEIPTNGVDNDCDGVVLFQIIDDPTTDSAFSTTNELSTFAIGWDADGLVFGYDYTIETNAIIWYFDLGINGGETDFNSSRGWGGVYPSDVVLSQSVEFMAASYGDGPLGLFTVIDGTSTDVTAEGSGVRSSYLADGSPGRAIGHIPWDVLYDRGAGKVAPGARLRIVGVIRANDNQGPADIAPNNGGATINTYASIDVDLDSDGVPDLDLFLDTDEDGFAPIEGDCDDGNPDVNPNEVEICNQIDDDCDGLRDEGVKLTLYIDGDLDGHGDAEKPVQGCGPSTGISDLDDDCDDLDGDNFPNNDESCDEGDNDCDTTIDEGAGPLWYADGDEDGFRVDEGGVQACEGDEPAGTLPDSAGIDCDDDDEAVNPDADEVCNDIDDDCDGEVDGPDADGATSWYADSDDDGFGDAGDEVVACEAPEGYVADNTDCDDTTAQALPGGTEVCGDFLDNDCDETVDEDGAQDAPTWYADGDDDGFGADETTLVQCEQPEGYVSQGGDCQDDNGAVFPGADEVCSETGAVDDDCDGTVDEDPINGATWHPDVDGDGYGDSDTTVMACSQPDDHVSDGSDCDDSDASVNPDGTEIPGNDVDEDCDGDIPGAPSPTPTVTPPTPTVADETPTPTATDAPATATPEPPTPTAEPPTPTLAPETSPPQTEPPTPTAPTGTESPTVAPTAAPTATLAPTAAPTDPPGATPTGSDDEEGCGGCSSASDGGASAAALLLMALAVGMRRRRR